MSFQKLILPTEFLKLKALTAIIYIVLELYYYYFISVEFSYMGYSFEFDFQKYLISKLVFFLLLVGSYDLYFRSKFLYSIYLLLFFFFFIPNSILFSFCNIASGPFFANSFFLFVFLISPYVKFSIPYFRYPVKYKIIGLIGISILLLIPIVIRFKMNFNLNTLLLREIYETRDVFSNLLQGYLTYLYNFEAKTVIPIAMVFFLIRKKVPYIFLFTGILLYLFVISGNKAVYFTTIIAIFFYYFGRDYVSKISNFFMLMIMLFLVIPLLDNFIFNRPLLGGTFVNRFLFIPALLTHWYFDFFEGKPFYFAETHFFNLFVDSPYDKPIGFYLSSIYWPGSTAYANNGIISDGFMNLGYIGVIIFSVAFAILFSFFNSLNIDKGYYGIFFSYIYIMLSAPFFTCIITGGILPFILISFAILNNKGEIESTIH